MAGTRKTNKQKQEELRAKIEKLKAQERALNARINKEERAARTRRLIQNGALVEKFFDCANIEPEKLEELLRDIVSYEPVQERLFSFRLDQIEDIEVPEPEDEIFYSEENIERLTNSVEQMDGNSQG